MIKKILTAVTAVLLVVIALQPGGFRVERSATLAASSAALIEQVTIVTWAMYGPQTIMTKAISPVLDCEKMCGPQFEKSLASLGKAASAQPTPITKSETP